MRKKKGEASAIPRRERKKTCREVKPEANQNLVFTE